MFRQSRSTRPLLLMVLTMSVSMFLLAGCASDNGASGGDAPSSASNESYPAGYSAPPPGSKLAKVELEMNDIEVRKIMGEPDDSNAYMTGKAWIPFYYGPDTARTDWMYKGQGRVVFSRNRYSGGLKVIRVLYNANES